MENDYISREAVILTLLFKGQCSRRYKLGEVWELNFSEIREAIATIPAADVRPVVLCRDCKHFNPYPGDCTDGVIEGVCKRHNSIGVLVMDEDFCSDAERI